MFGFFLYVFYMATFLCEKGLLNPRTNKGHNIEEVIQVIFSIIISLMATMRIIPSINKVSKAQTCGGMVFEVIER